MKKKICSVCNQETFLFKSNPKLCQSCYQKSYNKPIKKVSDKHKETLKEYKVIKAELIAEKLKQGITSCEIKSPVCTYTFEEVHHIASKDSKELYLDKKNMLLICRACHNYIHFQNSEWGYSKGFMIHKNQINEKQI